LFLIALDDIGMTGSITNFLSLYSEQIAFEILQSLVNTSLSLAVQAAETRSNKDTAQSITNFVSSITTLQQQINSYATLYVKKDPVVIVQELNYLRSYAQNQMSPQIMQKVNFAKQLGSY
jgi:type IV secretory pathway VirB10-like protein